MNQEQDENQKKLYLDTNLQIIFGVTLTAVLGVASITPAFPTIIQEFGVSSLGVGGASLGALNVTIIGDLYSGAGLSALMFLFGLITIR